MSLTHRASAISLLLFLCTLLPSNLFEVEQRVNNVSAELGEPLNENIINRGVHL